MTITIISFDEADYDEANIHHIIARHQYGTTLPTRLWLDKWASGKKVGADMSKRRDLTVSFEDSNEGRVFLAMKRGVLEWLSEAIKSRLDEEEPLNVAANYADAIAALNEIDKQQDVEIGGEKDDDAEI